MIDDKDATDDDATDEDATDEEPRDEEPTDESGSNILEPKNFIFNILERNE